MSIDAKTARFWSVCIPSTETDANYQTPFLPSDWAILNTVIGKKSFESASPGNK
jgi:hypothetical protein